MEMPIRLLSITCRDNNTGCHIGGNSVACCGNFLPEPCKAHIKDLKKQVFLVLNNSNVVFYRTVTVCSHTNLPHSLLLIHTAATRLLNRKRQAFPSL